MRVFRFRGPWGSQGHDDVLTSVFISFGVALSPLAPAVVIMVTLPGCVACSYEDAGYMKSDLRKVRRGLVVLWEYKAAEPLRA